MALQEEKLPMQQTRTKCHLLHPIVFQHYHSKQNTIAKRQDLRFILNYLAQMNTFAMDRIRKS